MYTRANLAELQEKLGKLIADAHAAGVALKDAEDKNLATGELAEKFDKLSADAIKVKAQHDRVQAWLELQDTAEALKRPATERLGFRSATQIKETAAAMLAKGEIATQRERRKAERQMRARMEQFAAAGVKTIGEFERFREAHAEATLAYLTTPAMSNAAIAAMGAFEKAGFKPQEAFALVSGVADLGGYLVSDDMQAEIIRNLAAFSEFRGLCRTVTTSGPAAVFPTIAPRTGAGASIYPSTFAGSWKPEGYVTGGTAPTVQNNPRFGQARVPVFTWAPDAIELTQELIADAKADVEGVIAELIAETLALDAEDKGINGVGDVGPLGLLNTTTDNALTATNSGDADEITYNGLVDVQFKVPSQYRRNGAYLMASLTFAKTLKLKDGQQMPIFPVNQVPGTLFGKRVAFSDLMPIEGTDTFPVIFGDFRYYVIADRQELRIQRLVERFAPNVGLLPTAREGGMPIRTDAFRKLKCAV
jgi:HK97 family phage major capsid protein